MSAPPPTYWPFPILPPDQRTDQHRREVRFLEEAYRDGFRPCKFSDGEYRIESDNGRTAWVISRGRLRSGTSTRWEVWLNDGSERIRAFWADGFEPAVRTARRWLVGGTADESFGLTHERSDYAPQHAI